MDRSNGREEKLCYGIVGNIPKEFHSADLRAMFSNFINSETDGFKCFHFRHRPEFRREKEDDDVNEETCVSSTTCCVILILEAKLQELIAGYHGKNWVDRKGKYHPSKAVISKIRVKAGEGLCRLFLNKQIRGRSMRTLIGHFRVHLSLHFEARPSAKSLL